MVLKCKVPAQSGKGGACSDGLAYSKCDICTNWVGSSQGTMIGGCSIARDSWASEIENIKHVEPRKSCMHKRKVPKCAWFYEMRGGQDENESNLTCTTKICRSAGRES